MGLCVATSAKGGIIGGTSVYIGSYRFAGAIVGGHYHLILLDMADTVWHDGALL